MSQPVIAVCGATGRQGGSVVEALLKEGKWKVRGLTRKLDSEPAQALRGAGVEVVKADFLDVESLKAAFEGCYGVFGMTNYWEKAEKDNEIEEGKRLVDAAKAVGVKHFIWSTVARPPKGIAVSHWDSKADINEYLIASGLPRTTLVTVYFFENFYLFPWFQLKKVAEDKYLADWPFLWSDGLIGGYSVAETGVYAAEIFAHPDKWLGKDMYANHQSFTPRDFVNALNDALTGKATVELKETTRQIFESMRPHSEELWSNMESFYVAKGRMREMNITSEEQLAASKRDEEIERSIFPGFCTVDRFVKENLDKILAAAVPAA